MREIKLRFFCPEDRSCGKPAITHERYCEYEGQGINEFLRECQKMGLVILQYTGLKDKNGKEIYDGDVLSMNRFLVPFEVYWYREVAGWGLRDKNGNPYDNGDYYRGDDVLWEDATVIGNRWENPELLEAKP